MMHLLIYDLPIRLLHPLSTRKALRLSHMMLSCFNFLLLCTTSFSCVPLPVMFTAGGKKVSENGWLVEVVVCEGEYWSTWVLVF